jgi:hypothetical protein
MTQTQIEGVRNFWTALQTKQEVMTAKEMALTPHKLSKTGNYARTEKGVYVWSDTVNQWLKLEN